MIRVTGVVHHYGVRPVLRNINLHVAAGELLALMGPNGMGKSTLLAVLAGLLSPLRGTVEIAGKRRRGSVADEEALRRQVVYLPDQPWLPGLRTGREFLLAVGRLYGVERDRLMEHTDQLLALFQLTGQADAPIRTYSAGQQKKIAISSTLVSEAPVLLLDEPFSGGLDPSAILALKQVLKRLAERKDVTVVMATPVPELVEELAQRVAVLRDGEIVACDTVAGLRRLSGCAGSLGEVYERLTNPDVLEHIERYLRRTVP